MPAKPPSKRRRWRSRLCCTSASSSSSVCCPRAMSIGARPPEGGILSPSHPRSRARNSSSGSTLVSDTGVLLLFQHRGDALVVVGDRAVQQRVEDHAAEVEV